VESPSPSEFVLKAVFDCNIFAQALLNPAGPAGACVQAAFDGRVALIISDYVIEEIRAIPDKPVPARIGVTRAKAEDLIQLLLLRADYISHVPALFVHPIDEDDSAYVNLALAAGAGLIVSRDRHLLNLNEPGKPWSADFRAQFPKLRVVGAEQLLAEIRDGRR
jgi:putative PIN family toxin of toxin-antitoxin system